MRKVLKNIKESFISVGPVSVIIMLLYVLLVPNFSWSVFLAFFIGSIILTLGMTFFNLGADVSMMEMGDLMSGRLAKTKNLPLILTITFLIAFAITCAEPDLSVLSLQLFGENSAKKWLLILSISLGVAILLCVAMLRTFYQFDLNKILIVCYSIIFVITIVSAILIEQGKLSNFLGLAFDSGGATTGPITVPFVMAYGIGISKIHGGESKDSFGLIALGSIGPIIIVLILGLCGTITEVDTTIYSSEISLASVFMVMPECFIETLIPLLIIYLIFMIFQTFMIKIGKQKFKKITIGMLYTLVGLALFLSAVNAVFMPMGILLGQTLASRNLGWLLVPLGAIIGFFIIMAEPAVQILAKQVEDISGGTISKKTILIALMVGMSIAVALSMLRVVFNIHILYILIPFYLIAIVLSFFVPKVFTAVAFDSGGVASGPMSASFLLPLAIGYALTVGDSNYVLCNAFGVIGFVAMSPLVVIQIVGLIATIKLKKAKKENATETVDEEIVEF